MDDVSPITVRSERQAMDWSLVLASQGIETTITHSAETGQWALLVNSADYARACQSLRLYLIENRNRRWQQELKFTGLLFDWRCLFWGLYLGVMFYLGAVLPVDLSEIGHLDAGAVQAGEWWRFFTATTLHDGIGHLTANLTSGLLLIGFAMGAYGVGTVLLAILFAGALGNVATWAIHGVPYHSLGASGMVMAGLGLLVVHSLSLRGHPSAATLIRRGLLAGLLLLILLGLNPASDVTAHVGGFVGGSLLGILLTLAAERGFNRARWDDLFAWLTGALLAMAWALAIVSSHWRA